MYYSVSRSEPFERDFFNTRKLVLLTTLEVSSSDGRMN